MTQPDAAPESSAEPSAGLDAAGRPVVDPSAKWSVSSAAAGSALALESPGRLLAEIVCPHCWHRFPPEQVRFVARHAEMLGDDRLGDSEYRRFLPTRFTPSGEALDARGLPCHELACPRCHLTLSRAMLEMMPFFLSIVGAPASGKSCLLAAMLWQARQLLGRFALALADADPQANRRLQAEEQRLLLNPDPETPIAVRKTETTGDELYRQSRLDGQTQTFPNPFVFTLMPHERHPRAEDPFFPHRALVLYDNAGESFLPGADTPSMPVTRHLAESEAILFVFDPLQDPRLRRRCSGEDPQLSHGPRPSLSWGQTTRQEVVLHEVAARVRRYHNLAATRRHDRPLIVVLAKADVWGHLAGLDLDTEPLIEPSRPDHGPVDPLAIPKLDIERIGRASDACRGLLLEACPELVNAAEGFCERVLYAPVSALGGSPERVEAAPGQPFYGVRPGRVRPKWAVAPLLSALRIRLPGLIQ